MNVPSPIRRLPRWILLAAAALLLVRALLPWGIKAYVHRTLDRIPAYDGRVRDVDLHIWRGAYEIEGLEIVKETGDVPLPFLSAEKLDLSVEWKALFRGSLVGEIRVEAPKLNIVTESPVQKAPPAGAGKPGAQTGMEGDAEKHWTSAVRDLFPLRIDRFSIQGGEVHLRDLRGAPPVDVEIRDLQLEARNLTNSGKISKTLMASVRGNGTLPGDGSIHLRVDLNPFKKDPTFDLDLSLINVDMTRLNDLFRHRAGIDVEAGRMSVFLECASSEGQFKGYVKPLFKGLEVTDGKEDRSFTEKVKETAVELVAKILRNDEDDTVATRLPFAGRYGGTEVGVWTAVLTLFRHAFVEALSPALDRSIGLKGS